MTVTKDSSRQEFELSGLEMACRLRNFVSSESIVLDLGCGIGRIARYLAPYCKEIYCVDASTVILRKAKKFLQNIPNVVIQRNNGKDLRNFPSNFFDFIYCIGVLQHLDKEDASSYVREIFRVSRMDGHCFVHFKNLESGKGICNFFSYIETADRNHARVRYHTVPEVNAILRYIGLEILDLSARDDDIYVVARKRDLLSNSTN